MPYYLPMHTSNVRVLRSAAVVLTALCAVVLTGAQSPAPVPFDLEEATIAGLQQRMQSGQDTSRSLVDKYLARIEALDRSGPALHSVLEVNPDARTIADRLDAERKSRGPRGPLHGIPILIKDNIATADRMMTTAGSLALAGATPPKDAFIVSRLREAGAVILGKTNLSEWANFRSTHSTSGWSGRGGQTKNPYALDRNPSGSSSGSGASIAANLAAAAVGTETDGSIVSPSNSNGLVGFKPTLGLVSRSGIVPIAHSQDTAGPMTRTVADAAALLGAMTGEDPDDPATGPTHRSAPTSGAGTRSGVAARNDAGTQSGVAARNDAGTQSGVAARNDAGTQSGVAARSDAGTQSGVAARSDAGTQSGIEARNDAGTQSGIEARNDAGTRSGAGAPSGVGTPSVVGADSHVRPGPTDYTQFLDPNGLKGARIGVVRNKYFGYSPAADRLAEAAIAEMKKQGATIVDPANIATLGTFDDGELEVLLFEFKADLNKYLTWLGAASPVHSLTDVIAFNDTHKDQEMPYFGQEIMAMADKKGPLTSAKYTAALARNHRMARTLGIDAVMRKFKLDALVAPTGGPAWLTDIVNGDSSAANAASPSTVTSVAGYPHITVPAGYSRGLPVGISFFGRAWSEATLIRLAYAYEQATKHRRPPAFAPTVDVR
jgi:Asp-tRNA(Asn)/Glu-tRNA(Gln) amidotransferase A subunit family amidase